jgi:hypothetical protein
MSLLVEIILWSLFSLACLATLALCALAWMCRDSQADPIEAGFRPERDKKWRDREIEALAEMMAKLQVHGEDN